MPKFFEKKSIAAALFLSIELTYLCVLFVLYHQTEVEMQKQLRANTIIAKSNMVSKLFYDAGIAIAGYSITKNQLLSDRYGKVSLTIPQEVSDLRTAIGNTPAEKQIGTSVNQISSSGLEILNEAKSQSESDHFDTSQVNLREMYREIRSLADRLSNELTQLIDIEHKVEKESAVASKACQFALNLCFAFGLALNITLAIIMVRCQRV